MTNPRAERRNFLHEELGNVRIVKEDVHKLYTDFTIANNYGDTRTYRVYGNRMTDMEIC